MLFHVEGGEFFACRRARLCIRGKGIDETVCESAGDLEVKK